MNVVGLAVRILSIVFIILIGGGTEDVYATQQWHVRGYLSQTYSNTSDQVNYGGESQDGAFDIRNLGVNFSNDYLFDRARFAGQATYRSFGEVDDGSLELDFLVLDFSLLQDFDYRLWLELGRLKTEFGFYISGWDVAHARPFVLLPITLYEESYREFLYSADGLRSALRYYWRGYWQAELFFGKPSGDAEKFADIFRQEIFNQDIRVEDIGNLHGASLFYESEQGFFKSYLGYAKSETPFAFGPLVTFGLAPEDGAADMVWTTLGLKFNYKLLYLIGEARYGEIDIRSAIPQGLLRLLPDYARELSFLKPFSFYVAAGYRVSNSLEIYTYYGETWADQGDRRGEHLSSITGIAPSLFFLRTVSLGARWDLSKRAMVGVQWHRSHGQTVLSSRDNEDVFALPEQWDMLNLIFSYHF